MLVHLQRHGHTPIALFGGVTGRVGDPSGKDAERKMLDIEVIENNLKHQKKQFQHILRFAQGDNKLEIVNNYHWFKDIGFLDFLRDAGKHLTVNYMMSKESVKRRIETGISFTEFSYQLLPTPWGLSYKRVAQINGEILPQVVNLLEEKYAAMLMQLLVHCLPKVIELSLVKAKGKTSDLAEK